MLRSVMRKRAQESGARIAELRKAKGMGPTMFAGIVGVPLQTLHKIEHGQIVPRDHLKATIALALGVELADLYRWPSTAELVKAVAA